MPDNRPVVMISAGLRGLGKAMTVAFAEEGYRVAVTTRSPEGADLALDPAKFDTYISPLTAIEDGDLWIRHVIERWGQVDVLINNLGPYLFELPTVVDTTNDEWAEVLTGNLTIPFSLARTVIPTMRRQGFGRIINIGFVGAGQARGWVGRGAYAAAKAGLASLTRTIAAEEHGHGIASMMICPSDIRHDNKEKTDLPPLSQFPRPPVGGDLARIAVFMADRASSYLNGSIVELANPVSSIHKTWRHPDSLEEHSDHD